MTKTYKSPVDEAIGKTLEKPETEPLQGRVFEHLFPVSPKRKKIILPNQPEERRMGERCGVCDTFYFDSENMIDETGQCENCREGLEIIHKHEKNSKAIP